MKGSGATGRLVSVVMVVAVLGLMGGPLGLASGGLTVNGFGVGDAVSSTGEACPGVPFAVSAVYLPGEAGLLTFSWVGVDCFNNGGYTALGVLRYDLNARPPTAQWEFACRGSQVEGLDCGPVAIGPYGGLGSQMWLRMEGGVERFVGVFTAY